MEIHASIGKLEAQQVDTLVVGLFQQEPELGQTAKRIDELMSGAISELVASGDMDGNIWLWDPATGKPLGTCKGHSKWITSLVSEMVGVWWVAAAGSGSRADLHSHILFPLPGPGPALQQQLLPAIS